MSTRRVSRQANLRTLLVAGADEATALMRLAAFHNKSEQGMIPVRKSNVRAGQQVFPPHQLVSELLAVSVFCMQQLFSESLDENDDLLIAAYCIYLITAIHPFADKNGHVAFDFGQYQLMRRWDSSVPPLFYQSDTHRSLRMAFAPIDKPCNGESDEEVLEASKYLLAMMTSYHLRELWQNPNLVAVAHFLAEASGMQFVSKGVTASASGTS